MQGFFGIGARAGGNIRKMKWAAADRFCRGLGDGSRLPTREEYEALGRAMRPGERYNPDLIADMRGNWFWSSFSSSRDDDYALVLSVRLYGGIDALHRVFLAVASVVSVSPRVVNLLIL
jgi:hypothetical protein